MLVRDNHSSLFTRKISDEVKTFFDIGICKTVKIFGFPEYKARVFALVNHFLAWQKHFVTVANATRFWGAH